MRRHAYSSTTTADLWSALQAASGKPVTAIAAGFTEQGGIPLVIAQASCAGDSQRITLRQERFTIHDPAPQPQRWRVPVTRGGVEGVADETELLDGAAEIAAGRRRGPAKLHPGRGGHSPGPYDPARPPARPRPSTRLPPGCPASL